MAVVAPRRSTRNSLGRASVLFLLAAVFGVGLWLSLTHDLTVRLERVAVAGPAGVVYEPLYRQAQGPEIVLVFVGSSRCAWSNDQDLPPALEALKVRLAQHAREAGLAFRALGVAADWGSERGVAYLTAFGAFDEISTGSNWTNSALLDHVWEAGVTVATPAVFVYQQVLEIDSDSVSIRGMSRKERRLLAYRTGLPAIRALAEADPAAFLGVDSAGIPLDSRVGFDSP